MGGTGNQNDDDGGQTPHTMGFFAVCMTVWGTTWIAITFQLGDVDVSASVSYRFFLAGALLALFAWRRGSLKRPSLVDGMFIVGIGLLYAVNYQLIYFAGATIRSGLLAVTSATILFFNIFLQRVFFGVTPRSAVVVGACVGLTGVVFVFWSDVVQTAFDARALAISAAVLGAFLSSLGNIVSERNARRGISTSTQNVGWMLTASAASALTVVVSDDVFGFSPTVPYVSSLLYLSVFGSIVAFTSYLKLIERVGSGVAGYVAVVTPVVALLLSSIFEELAWPPSRIFGVVLIMGGQVLVLRRRRKPTT